MDETTMYIFALVAIFLSPVAVLFLLSVLMMLGMACGIIGKVFDFFTDSIAGQESTKLRRRQKRRTKIMGIKRRFDYISADRFVSEIVNVGEALSPAMSLKYVEANSGTLLAQPIRLMWLFQPVHFLFPYLFAMMLPS